MVLPYMGYKGNFAAHHQDMLFASDSGKREYNPWVWYSWSNLGAKLHPPCRFIIEPAITTGFGISYFYINYCREQGHKFISFCLKQVQSLRDSAAHAHSKFKGVPPMLRYSKNRALVWSKISCDFRLKRGAVFWIHQQYSFVQGKCQPWLGIWGKP